jgi:diacylglycerol O-acyltransferase / wax synthase
LPPVERYGDDMAAPERLTALDASFLYLERPAMHMHVVGLSILDPSTRADGRLTFDDVRTVIASRLHVAPRLRQKVAMLLFNFGLRLWVVDPEFDVGFQLGRAALP